MEHDEFEDDEYEGGPVIEVFTDPQLIEDCADFFATKLTWQFPELELERFSPNEWRSGWMIKIPHQFTTPVREVEELAVEIRDRLFWEKSILIPYAIEQL